MLYDVLVDPLSDDQLLGPASFCPKKRAPGRMVPARVICGARHKSGSFANLNALRAFV